MNYDHIPATLKDSARFCVWSYRVRAGKPTKVPYNPCTGAKARSNDPGTFSTFDDATAALSRYPSEYSGVGVGMFGDLVGVDIDHCIDESGELTALSQEIADKLGSYTERSPSGTGIHILCRAPGLTFDKERYYVKNSRIGLEVYPAGVTQCSDLSVFDSGRALVLPFSRHFEDWEQDKGLKSEFRKPENQSGILNWLIQGFQKYQEHGLTPPESVRAATRDYRQDSDKIARFMEDAMEQVPDSEIRLTLLYAAFKLWCQQNGQYVESSRNFRRLLDRAGVQIVKKRPKSGGENTTMVIGYTVVPGYLQVA